MSLRIVTPPASEPISVAEATAWGRISDSSAAAVTLLTMLISAARRIAERDTGRKLITQTWELVLDGFNADEIEIGVLPIQSISFVKYYDADAALQTLAADRYTLDPDVLPGWLLPAYGTSWPGTQAAANVVIVRFIAGYGAATDVPADIRSWISAQVTSAYDHPDMLIAGDAKHSPFLDGLLDGYKIRHVV